ncbi:MAG: dihydroorotase [Proteobacteria bacterium]|nr:dihydroorotase [Pseudomonadota bacterium]MBU1640904.1 dihydroorotase [Pseudomonadota bacterium]
MPQSLLLKNGRIIDPANGIDNPGSILIEDGRIKAVYSGDFADSLQEDCQVIDASGKWIVPGLVDMHVHLREPGQEYKETVETGTKAAASGGFTAVACMPNTSPVNDNEAVTALILAKAKKAGFAKVYPVGAISHHSDGSRLAEFGELKKAGAVALSDDGQPVENSQLMRRALEYSANYNFLLISHAEDMSLSGSGVMNEGPLSTRLGLAGIPSIAEEIMIYRDLAIAEYVNRPIHIAHISTRESVDLIRRAKLKGCQVTAETTPHYFTLTEKAVGDYNTLAKMNPPLRSIDDRQAIQDGLQDGTIDAIATDHAPHSRLEKEVEFDLAANGIIGLETSVPLTLALVRDEIITPARMIELMSVNPCRILGVEGGSLAQGVPADITLIDPDRIFTYEEKDVVSKSKNSPFLDWSLQGKAVLTLLDGNITYSDL